MERIKRNKLNKKDISLAKPFDLSILGTEDDVCFGKYHDTTKSACQQCGDAEFCSIVTAQKLKITRLKLESENTFKDIEPLGEVPYKECRAWVKEKLKSGRRTIDELKTECIQELKIGPFLWDKHVTRIIDRCPYIHLSNDSNSLIYRERDDTTK